MNTHSSIYGSTKGKTGSKVQKIHFLQHCVQSTRTSFTNLLPPPGNPKKSGVPRPTPKNAIKGVIPWYGTEGLFSANQRSSHGYIGQYKSRAGLEYKSRCTVRTLGHCHRACSLPSLKGSELVRRQYSSARTIHKQTQRTPHARVHSTQNGTLTRNSTQWKRRIK